MEDLKQEKEKLHRIDFLYIASMVMFFLGWAALRNPAYTENISSSQDYAIYAEVWFAAIATFSLGAIICYFIGIFKIKKYNSNDSINDPDMKYKINHYYGFFNFLLIFPLDFGLLFMILTYNLFPAHWSSIVLYGGISLFFLVSFILRSTILKREDQMGLRAFDFNSFLYYSYAMLMVTLNVFHVKIDMLWMVLLILINFTITNFSVYYPVKAMVYAKEKREFNPLITVYKFVRRMIDKKIFFFVGLTFNLLLGGFYWIGGVATVNDQLFNIYFIIALFYFGLSIVRFFTFLWKKRIDMNEEGGENRLRAESKITIFNSLTTFILTLLLGALLFYIFNDSVKKEAQSWFIFIQAGFVGLRIVFLIMDIIKANKANNPLNIAIAEEGVLFTSVMLFSVMLSINLYFGFGSFHKWFSIIMVFFILTSGVFISLHTLILGILGMKGKLKVREEENE